MSNVRERCTESTRVVPEPCDFFETALEEAARQRGITKFTIVTCSFSVRVNSEDSMLVQMLSNEYCSYEYEQDRRKMNQVQFSYSTSFVS